jgi:hypothetical protein
MGGELFVGIGELSGSPFFWPESQFPQFDALYALKTSGSGAEPQKGLSFTKEHHFV